MALYLGIDVGSTTSKCVILDDGGAVVGWGLHPSGAGTAGPARAREAALELAGVPLSAIAASCSTGYGRHLQEWADFQMSELSCHAKGAAHLFDDVRTVIDIGGQDAKVLSLDESGSLANFVMNDKCAAGTGRFLDVMAQVFGCANDELSALDDQASDMAQISSTCTVFAESEVISKLAAGTPIPNVAAGVHASVVDRVYGLVQRLGVRPNVVMTGGVALNSALVRRLADKLGEPIATSEQSQLAGALGAALVARDKGASEQPPSAQSASEQEPARG